MSPLDTKVLGLLAARGGSKGLRDKNTKKIGDQSLAEWAGSALSHSPSIHRAICSTDSEQISSLARKAGLEVPFRRPAMLARDDTAILDVIIHALTFCQGHYEENYSHVVLVQATSPTVTYKDLEMAIALARDKDLDTVISACKVSPEGHPAVLFEPDGELVQSWLLGDSLAEQRRQTWPDFYARTGLVYVFRTERLLDGQTFYTGKTGFIEVEPDRAISIDTIDDFERAKNYLETKPAPDF